MADTVPGMAVAIDQRSKALGLTPKTFAEHAGLTGPGLAPVRNGVRKQYEAKTQQGVARALRWPFDWYQRLDAGEDWKAFPDVDHPEVPRSDSERLRALEDAVRELAQTVNRLAAERTRSREN